MAYFSDLSNKCQLAIGDDVRAIAWLDDKHSYTVGAVDAEFLQLLKRHAANQWMYVAAAGTHGCELCNKFGSGGNLIIPTKTMLYIAPEMIVHYIEAHSYKPPDEFIKAVLDCPEQGSPDYLRLIEKYMHHWNEVNNS